MNNYNLGTDNVEYLLAQCPNCGNITIYTRTSGSFITSAWLECKNCETGPSNHQFVSKINTESLT